MFDLRYPTHCTYKITLELSHLLTQLPRDNLRTRLILTHSLRNHDMTLK